jgi:hypothetical protein
MAIRGLYLSNIVRAENQKNSPEINYYGAACMLLIKSFIFGPKSSSRNLYIMDSKEKVHRTNTGYLLWDQWQ